MMTRQVQSLGGGPYIGPYVDTVDNAVAKTETAPIVIFDIEGNQIRQGDIIKQRGHDVYVEIDESFGYATKVRYVTYTDRVPHSADVSPKSLALHYKKVIPPNWVYEAFAQARSSYQGD